TRVSRWCWRESSSSAARRPPPQPSPKTPLRRQTVARTRERDALAKAHPVRLTKALVPGRATVALKSAPRTLIHGQARPPRVTHVYLIYRCRDGSLARSSHVVAAAIHSRPIRRHDIMKSA